MAGRRTKCTPELTESIVSVIADGNDKVVAAANAGISEATFYAWINRGEAEEKRLKAGGRRRKKEAPFLEFLEKVKKALAVVEVRNVSLVQKAATGFDTVVRTTVTRRRPLFDGNKVRRYSNGKVVYVNETTTTEKVERDWVWQAAAWLLERKFPDRYALRKIVQMQGQEDTGTAERIADAIEKAAKELTEDFERFEAEQGDL